MRTITVTVPPEREGASIYNFLRRELCMSSRLVRTLKHSEAGIMLNGKPARTIELLSCGDILELSMPEDENAIEPREGAIDIVYEDEDLLIINKPPGLAMHPTHNHQGDTLANLVTGYLLKKGAPAAFRTVGRLDKDTSGLVVCALNMHAAARLSGRIGKEYTAVAQGVFEGSGTIDRPIYRPDPMKTLRAAGDSGETAITHWEAVRTNGNLTLLKIRLETGRTHQIRVHFSSLGTPLAGDEMYGGSRLLIGRQALHCGEIRFSHPVTSEQLSLSVPVPQDMAALV